MNAPKKILLIDFDDLRRGTRVCLLENAGYIVSVHSRYEVTEALRHEDDYDLIVLALHAGPEEVASYSDRLTKQFPKLPILLLTDGAVFAREGTVSKSMGGESPIGFLTAVAEMLAGSSHIHEI